MQAYIISIHAPCTGSDVKRKENLKNQKGFQSTLPARGATLTSTVNRRMNTFQSTLPAREATHPADYAGASRRISIHAPCTGSDSNSGFSSVSPGKFQSTLPARGATIPSRPSSASSRYFNPRSLHGERLLRVSSGLATPHFNPRSLHGERQGLVFPGDAGAEFQSTLPARGATHLHRALTINAVISIHAPCTGSDRT